MQFMLMNYFVICVTVVDICRITKYNKVNVL